MTSGRPASARVIRSWEAREVAYLRTWYGKISTPRIAAHLQRSRASVAGKAFTLGMAKPEWLRRKQNEDEANPGAEWKYPTRRECLRACGSAEKVVLPDGRVCWRGVL